MKLIRKHRVSFKNALNGVIWAFSTQPNFRIHFLLSTVAIILSMLFNVSRLELVMIIFAIVFGFGAEMINTSIEAMTDLITKEYRQQAKIAKDVSAGMMLVIAFGTLMLALIILLPRIISKY